jgi:hypothetical protein
MDVGVSASGEVDLGRLSDDVAQVQRGVGVAVLHDQGPALDSGHDVTDAVSPARDGEPAGTATGDDDVGRATQLDPMEGADRPGLNGVGAVGFDAQAAGADDGCDQRGGGECHEYAEQFRHATAAAATQPAGTSPG